MRTSSVILCVWPGRRSAVRWKPASRCFGSSTPGTLNGVEAYNWATVAPAVLPVLVTSKLTCTVPSAVTCLGVTLMFE